MGGRSTSYIKYRDFVRALSADGDDDEDELATKVQRILRRRDDGPGEMDRLFREFDRNRDGDISEREFLRAMDKLRLDLTDSEARRLMRRFDRNNDGRISYREFIRFAEGRGGLASPSKRDRDGDRFSMDDDEDELAIKVQRILRRRDVGPGELDRLFREFDRNRDGDISEREFLRAMDKLRLDVTDSEARRLMRRFDRNN